MTFVRSWLEVVVKRGALNLQDLKMSDHKKNNDWKLQHPENDGPNRSPGICKTWKMKDQIAGAGKCRTWKMTEPTTLSSAATATVTAPAATATPDLCDVCLMAPRTLVRHFHGIAFDRACIFSRPAKSRGSFNIFVAVPVLF